MYCSKSKLKCIGCRSKSWEWFSKVTSIIPDFIWLKYRYVESLHSVLLSLEINYWYFCNTCICKILSPDYMAEVLHFCIVNSAKPFSILKSTNLRYVSKTHQFFPVDIILQVYSRLIRTYFCVGRLAWPFPF